MSTALKRREGVKTGGPGEAGLEPREAALCEIRGALERANREAQAKRRDANALRRRLVEVESGGAGVRRRRCRVRGFVLTDGTRVYGIEEAA